MMAARWESRGPGLGVVEVEARDGDLEIQTGPDSHVLIGC